MIGITGFDSVTSSHGWIILHQFLTYGLGIEVYEPYFGPSNNIIKCPVTTGSLIILDDLSDAGKDSIPVSDTTTHYSFRAGLPNITGGGPYPYQKRLEIQYKKGGLNAVSTIWAYIVGQRPRATAFTTTTPEIPLLILRDPPGDQSYSYFDQTKQVSQAIGFGMKHESGGGGYLKVSLGADFSYSTGFIFNSGTNIDVTLDFTAGVDVLMSQNSVTENQLTYTTNERISTSTDENVVGEKGDLYMGGAMNLLYGVTDILSIANEVVTIKQDIIIVPKGFATTYIYSGNYIENTVIPSLNLIGDTASAHRWESFLALNQRLKDNAVFVKNISFDAVNSFETSQTIEKTSTYTEEFDLLIDKKIAVDAGLTINGIGAVGGFYISSSYTTGQSVVNSTVNSTTIGYYLGDNDTQAGGQSDSFTVDVKSDPVYGTPVFVTKSGQSSCPWEKHTVPRQGCKLNPKTFAANAVPPTQPALFSLSLINTSQTGESWDYSLGVVNSTNPHSAAVMVGSHDLSDPINYTVQPGTSTGVTIAISKPAGENYDLTGLKVMLTSPCQSDSGFSDTATFDVHFIPPCSPVSIFSPGNNWVVNQAGSHMLQVKVTGYNLANTQLQSVGMEYSVNGTDWTQVFSTPKASITASYIVYDWNVGGFSDGDYKIRAVAICTGDTNYSEIRTGHIDMHPPQVVGTPQPSDGILSIGDEISFTFNEALDPASITVYNCKLLNAETGMQVGSGVQYNHGTNKIIFTLNPGLSYFVENQYLKSQIVGVKDQYGNPLAETANWIFYVDQGPLHWGENSFQYVVMKDSVFHFHSNLTNSSPNQVYYSVTATGSINSSPADGYLSAAGGNQNVQFITPNKHRGIPHYDTINASTLGFPPEKIYVLFYTPGFDTLYVADSVRNVSAAAGTTSFVVGSNIAWSVNESAGWLSAVPLIGYDNDTITVTYDANTSDAARTAEITISGEGVPLSKILRVVQAGVPLTLVVADHTVPSGAVECYKAMQNITVQNFIVESGGTVNLIAGNKINLVPDVHALNGSYFHGRWNHHGLK